MEKNEYNNSFTPLTEKSIRQFFEPYVKKIKADNDIINSIFDTSNEKLIKIDKSTFFNVMLDGSIQTISLLQNIDFKDKQFLEVGGGIGLTYAYLKSLKVDIISIEPSSSGFGSSYHAGLKILKMIGVDDSGWLPKSTSDLPEMDNKFDIIFSNFVLEHIPELKKAFEDMKSSLRIEGKMIHCCPNYTIPFEPHYKIILAPFFPRLTEHFLRWLKKDPFWEELHFTTVGEIKKICSSCGLKVNFEKGMLYWTFSRLLESPEYRDHKRMVYIFGRIMKAIGVLSLFKLIPPSLATPITFEVVFKNKFA